MNVWVKEYTCTCRLGGWRLEKERAEKVYITFWCLYMYILSFPIRDILGNNKNTPKNGVKKITPTKITVHSTTCSAISV
jgi:hypothetical protein